MENTKKIKEESVCGACHNPFRGGTYCPHKPQEEKECKHCWKWQNPSATDFHLDCEKCCSCGKSYQEQFKSSPDKMVEGEKHSKFCEKMIGRAGFQCRCNSLQEENCDGGSCKDNYFGAEDLIKLKKDRGEWKKYTSKLPQVEQEEWREQIAFRLKMAIDTELTEKDIEIAVNSMLDLLSTARKEEREYRDNQIRSRISNILASKYENEPPISEKIERAIMNCFNDDDFTPKQSNL